MRSLRVQITVSFAVLSAVIAVSMSAIVYRTSVDQRSTRLRALALAQAHDAAVIYGSTGALVSGATLNDRSAPGQLRQAVRAGRGATQIVSTHGALVVWAGVPVSGVSSVSLFVNNNAGEDARAISSLRETLVLTAIGIIGGGALIGAVLADRLSRRLRLAARKAHAIADGDLTVRLGAGGRDEVGVLSDAVDAMADALRARIERERNFNADVAHELRTPVTGLLAAADLLPGDDDVTAMIRERSRRLHRLVEDLLEIARLESGHEVADLRTIPLRPFIDEVAARYPGTTVTGSAVLNVDPRRLERIVVNLLENAVEHGEQPVTVALEPLMITIEDHGPGFPPGERVLTRHVTHASRGSGLGLAIAAEQATVLGATLELGNAEHGGGRAIVRWAAS